MRSVAPPTDEHERQRMVAAAIGRDHDRRALEHRACARIAVQARELVRRLAHELREHARLPEAAGAGIGGVDGKLRRHQHGVEPGLDDLPRHLLAVAHVAGERRAVAVEEHDDHRRLAEIEAARDRQQHAAVAVGRVLPEHAGTRRAPAPLALGDIQERLSGSRRDAVEGEWRDVERHQRAARRRHRPLRERRRASGAEHEHECSRKDAGRRDDYLNSSATILSQWSRCFTCSSGVMTFGVNPPCSGMSSRIVGGTSGRAGR